MTNAPPDLLAVQRYLQAKTGQSWASLGIIHSTPQGGGYHEGEDLLIAADRAPGPQYPGSDYSYTDSPRDLLPTGRLAGGDAASGLDAGGNFPRFLEFNAWMRQRMLAGDPRTADIREMIHTLDGRTVRRIDRTGKQPDSGDDSHLTHTHFSFFRDSLGRRDRDDNFLGLLKEFFDGVKPTAPQGEDVDIVQDYRLKILFENWDPTREQWIAAGGDPKVWDAANARGGARNGVKQTLNAISAQVADLAKKVTTPPPAQVTLTPAQLAQVVAQLKAELAPLIALARKLG